MAARNCLLPLPNFETEVHHQPFSQVQSHRMTTKKSHNASPMHAGCPLQLVVRNSAFSDRASEDVRYRRFSLMSIHGANYHSENPRNQQPVMLIAPSEVVLASGRESSGSWWWFSDAWSKASKRANVGDRPRTTLDCSIRELTLGFQPFQGISLTSPTVQAVSPTRGNCLRPHASRLSRTWTRPQGGRRRRAVSFGDGRRRSSGQQAIAQGMSYTCPKCKG